MESLVYVDDRGIMIGIKIADGTYIPILDESEKDKKKVILTTVRDEQPSVQIDLYRGAGSEMEDPQYLDTFKIDQIGEARKGEPEIELVMGVDEDGKLLATVKDLEGGNERSFEVDLASAPRAEPFAYDSGADFDLSPADEGEDFGGQEKTETPAPSYSPMNGQNASIHVHEGKNRKPLLILAIIALLVAAGVLCWFFLLRGRGEETVAATRPAAAPVEAPAPVPAAPAPAAPTPRPAAPAPEAPKPAAPKDTETATGVWYSIVRGDNLWNLSKSFYRTPWRFKKIAEENKIPNPDLIYTGNRIYIPDVETEKKR
ncbi:MAG: Hsp70 family protein [Spirochaetia bacterium]|jgi:nucleoid-associated protein YgaU|nr:Hsp70 family protein [Spirochaetia bacterium]